MITVKSSGSFYPANQVNKHLAFAILIKHRISISYFLSQYLYPGPHTGAYESRHAGSWAHIPGLMGPGTRDEIRIAPFPIKQRRKTKYFKRYICLKSIQSISGIQILM